MPDVRAFRAVRYRPDRVDMGAVLAPPLGGLDAGQAEALVEREPRNVVRLARADGAAGDGPEGAVQRARFLFAEWQRAGVMVRDERPALYGLRRGEDAVGFFARIPVRGPGALVVDGTPVAADSARLLQRTGVCVEPAIVAYADDRHRVTRALAAEMDREPDASFDVEGEAHALWMIDDESTIGRVSALLSTTTMRLIAGQEAWGAHQAAAAAIEASDDDTPTGWLALAFFVDEAAVDAFPAVPLGAVLGHLTGAL